MIAGTLYLCPSDRAARAFHAKLASIEIAPADCADIDRFCRELWQRGQLFGIIADAREIIDSNASAALWRYVVADETPLSDSEIGRVAELASDAWSLAHRYAMPVASLASVASGTDNVALFARCALRMQSLLKRHGGITQPELPSQLMPLLGGLRSLLPSRVVVTPAFASYPTQTRLLSKLAEQGVKLTAWSETAEKIAPPVAYRFADETQEIYAAIAWATTRTRNPTHALQGNVGIVVPDLSSRRDAWLAALREQLNPAGPHTSEIIHGDRLLRTGDRLVWLTNTPEHGLVNGEELLLSGIVRTPSGTKVELTTDDGKRLTLPLNEVDARLAYALSVHKSQGSEYAAVIVVLHRSAWPLLERRLLYTAITRAKKLCLLVGEARALRRAVTNGEAQIRRSGLAEDLRQRCLGSTQR